VEAFEQEARSARDAVAYFCVETRALAAWIPGNPEAVSMVIGAQPVWRPAALTRTLVDRPSLRAQLNRAANKNVSVSEWSPQRARDSAALQTCLHEWLDRRGLPPLHFLVEPHTLANLHDRHVFVAHRADVVVGFLVASPVAARNGWLVEQIVRGGAAPNGTAEALLSTAAEWMRDAGADMVTLGLSPLSRHVPLDIDGHPPGSIRALAAWLRVHGRRFYNFEGLDTFKAKFQPEAWEPVYAVLPDRRTTMRCLIAIGAAFGGTSAAAFTVKVLGHALGHELHALYRGVRTQKRRAAR
jgi:phosphatidylglycerol lysyltransferase